MGCGLSSGKKKGKSKSYELKEEQGLTMDGPLKGLEVQVKVSEAPLSQVLGKNTPIVAAVNTQGNFVAVQSGCTPLGFEDNEEAYMFGPNCNFLKFFSFFLENDKGS